VQCAARPQPQRIARRNLRDMTTYERRAKRGSRTTRDWRQTCRSIVMAAQSAAVLRPAGCVELVSLHQQN